MNIYLDVSGAIQTYTSGLPGPTGYALDQTFLANSLSYTGSTGAAAGASQYLNYFTNLVLNIQNQKTFVSPGIWTLYIYANCDPIYTNLMQIFYQLFVYDANQYGYNPPNFGTTPDHFITSSISSSTIPPTAGNLLPSNTYCALIGTSNTTNTIANNGGSNYTNPQYANVYTCSLLIPSNTTIPSYVNPAFQVQLYVTNVGSTGAAAIAFYQGESLGQASTYSYIASPIVLIGSTGPTGYKGYTGQTGPTGYTGPVGPQGAGGATGYYGSFYSDVSQNITVGSTTQVTLDGTFCNNGITQSGGVITFTYSGVYKISALFQVLIPNSNQNNTTSFDIFIRKNGSSAANNINFSNYQYQI
jgi:hypothetical protein